MAKPGRLADFISKILKPGREGRCKSSGPCVATDKAKRGLFDRLASHLTALADQVETVMLERKVHNFP
ncbi:hypothetical protein ABIF90_008388 [Bradyrhizobium japonicum]